MATRNDRLQCTWMMSFSSVQICIAFRLPRRGKMKLSCRLRLLSPIRCVIFLILSHPPGIWSFILCVQSLFVVFPIQITFLYPMYRMLYIAMPTRYVLSYPMCLFQFDSFLHPMCHRLYIFILSRMCSFIVYLICLVHS
jgi:hypothetical protein